MLVVADGKNAERGGRVFAADDCNYAFESLGAAGVDALDPRVWIGRVQNLSNQHPGQAEVVGILAGARSLARSIDHGDALADDGEVVIHKFFSPPSTQRTQRRYFP